ncbi:DUF3822 family protein [Ulvibacterium marinum]|uniref:DUF3822 family protein n=1 Tax=Ulvibacterium marinum TaxID=2419782 RepID=A0A3B0C0F8_9FLAO|nr:DUF3822 family protein [Ulvibacterium marinum]
MKKVNNNPKGISQDFLKLSIQVSLNGLSFCILDTIKNTVLLSEKKTFDITLTPYKLLKEVKDLFKKHSISQKEFSEVIVIHQNKLFGLVPKPLFNPEELPNYIKFNAKILASDHIDFDEIAGYDMVNVYVPFVNINNYIYELFGDFIFKHIGTVLIESLLKNHTNGKSPVCYVHVSEKNMDIVIISQKKLLLYNSFSFDTKEDFLYYLLFALEQLNLDAESVILRLFGSIEEDDEIYALCYEYIKHISIFVPTGASHPFIDAASENIDFAILNSL